MANITPAKFTYKDSDGDVGTVPALTDADVTLLNNALQDIEDLKLAYMPGYVKRDLSNLTDDGKIAIAHNAMPSAVYDNLTLGASGATYTAPADGFFWIAKYGDTGTYCQFVRTDGASTIGYSPITAGQNNVSMYVSKGEQISLNYNSTGPLLAFRFYYLNGSESEKA